MWDSHREEEEEEEEEEEDDDDDDDDDDEQQQQWERLTKANFCGSIIISPRYNICITPHEWNNCNEYNAFSSSIR